MPKHSESKTFRQSRRKVLKYAGVAAGTALAAPFAPYIRRARAEPVEINMLSWYGLAEPDMVEAFEAEHNVKFKPKYYAGGDNMLAALAQSPPGTFDIIHTDAEYARILIERGDLIDEMNPADYPFDDMLHEDFTQFPGHWKDGKLYSVINRFGHLGVTYNKEHVSLEEAMSYDVYWNPKLAGKVGHFDWHLPNLGQVSLLNGNNDPGPFDISADAWSKVREKTLSLKPQVKGFFDYGGTFSSLKNGEVLACVGIGDWVTGVLEKDGAPVGSAVPKEGGIQWTESYSIVSTSTKEGHRQEVHPVRDVSRRPGPLGQHGGISGLHGDQGGHEGAAGTDPGRSPADGTGRGSVQQPDHLDQRRSYPLSRHPEAAKPRGVERILVRVQERVIRTRRRAGFGHGGRPGPPAPRVQTARQERDAGLASAMPGTN